MLYQPKNKGFVGKKGRVHLIVQKKVQVCILKYMYILHVLKNVVFHLDIGPLISDHRQKLERLKP